jgi:hypothetical protein
MPPTRTWRYERHCCLRWRRTGGGNEEGGRGVVWPLGATTGIPGHGGAPIIVDARFTNVGEL